MESIFRGAPIANKVGMSDTKPICSDQFKTGMRTLAGAVNIVTSANSGKRYGMTATAVCSATADPPTVLVCINKLAITHRAVARSKAFCVNVLRAEDWELSTIFSGARVGETRFDTRDWTCLATGSPVLTDSLVSFDCRVAKRFAFGTHTIFLGQVEQVLLGSAGKPLLYSDGRYARLATLITGEAPPEGWDYWSF